MLVYIELKLIHSLIIIIVGNKIDNKYIIGLHFNKNIQKNTHRQ